MERACGQFDDRGADSRLSALARGVGFGGSAEDFAGVVEMFLVEQGGQPLVEFADHRGLLDVDILRILVS